MKRIATVSIILVLLVAAMNTLFLREEVKGQSNLVLVDYYHGQPDQVDDYKKFMEPFLVRRGYELKLNGKEEFSKEFLSQYFAVIVLEPSPRGFTSEEVRNVKTWVRGGGNLIILGENPNREKTVEEFNKLGEKFGCKLVGGEGFPIDEENHGIRGEDDEMYVYAYPEKNKLAKIISKGVKKTMMAIGAVLEIESPMYPIFSTSKSSYLGLSERPGPFVTTSGAKIKDGKVICHGDSSWWSGFPPFSSARDTEIHKQANTEAIFENIFDWFEGKVDFEEEAVEEEPGEKPGGEVPAEEITPEQVQTALDEAKTAIDKGKAKGVDMSEAEALLAEAEGMSESDPAGAIETAGEVPALVDELIQYGAEEVKDLLTDMEELFREAEDANAEKNAPDLYNEAKSLRDQAQSALANGEIGKAKDIAKQAEQKIKDATEKAKEAEAAKMRTQSTIIWIIVGVLVIVLIVVGKKYMKSPEE
ncbi:MAG: hypothetical protein ACE5K0_09550 [Candidatus Methanofastidiosia archaeon]